MNKSIIKQRAIQRELILRKQINCVSFKTGFTKTFSLSLIYITLYDNARYNDRNTRPTKCLLILLSAKIFKTVLVDLGQRC